MPTFVLVAGPPGSGKSSLAGPLARELGLPLLAKDEIKEALMGALGPPATVEKSRQQVPATPGTSTTSDRPRSSGTSTT